MPIVVSHQPDLSLLARAGYIAGAGQYQQWQEEMAQRERMQERALQANLYSQQMAQYNAMERMSYGAALDQQAAIQRQTAEQDYRRQLAEWQSQDRMDQLQMEYKLRRDAMLSESENAGNADIVKFLTSQADNKLAAIDQAMLDGYEFEGDGLQQYQAIQQKIAKIQQDPTVPGLTRAQAIYEVASGAPIPKLKRPSFQEEVQSRTAVLPTPDGRQIMVGPVRELQVLDDGPEQPKQEKFEPSTPTEMVTRDTSAFGALMKMAAEAVTKTDERVDPNTGKSTKTVTPPSAEQAAKWAVDYVRKFEKEMGTDGAELLEYDPATGELK